MVGCRSFFGRPFLCDVKARINVGAEVIRFLIGKKNLMFRFRAQEEQCYVVHNDVEQLGGGTEPQPQLKQPPTTLAKTKKTNKVWRKVEKTSPSTSREWDAEWY